MGVCRAVERKALGAGTLRCRMGTAGTMGVEYSTMTTVTISLPLEVKRMAETEAARAGHSLDEYVARLILSQADRPIDPAMEAELLKGLRSPARAFTVADFEARKQKLDGR